MSTPQRMYKSKNKLRVNTLEWNVDVCVFIWASVLWGYGKLYRILYTYLEIYK